MRRFFLSPLIRVSFGLAMLTVSLLFVSEFLGMVPDKRANELESRKIIAQSLAVQLSSAIYNNEVASIEDTLNTVIDWNDSILSAAIRPAESDQLYQFGDHDSHWALAETDKSTATQVQVAIYGEDGRWGNMEIRFAPIGATQGFEGFRTSHLALVLFIAIVGFVSYMVFLKRVVRELNTDNIIPNRVRRALDSLTESLLIVDQTGLIVFSNSAFSSMTGMSSDSILGKTTTDYDWEFDTTGLEDNQLPWDQVLDGSKVLQGKLIKLRTDSDRVYHLTVNATPVLSTEDTIQGALITFNDISEIEAKNEELRSTLRKLEETQTEVTLQNEKLQILATRDPMTNTLNRRSLFQGLDGLFDNAVKENQALSFIMVDIDHFKSVNDTYGHATGDRVIVFLANCLTKHSRDIDLVARFGGEEFCVVLPGTEIHEAAELAERMRLEVENGHGGDYTDELKITASFGVSILNDQISNPNSLFELADQALYRAKEGGRNQVVCWSESFSESKTPNTSIVRQSATTEPQSADNTVEKPVDTIAEQHIPPTITHIDGAISASEVSGKKLAVLVIDIDFGHTERDLSKLYLGTEFMTEISKRYLSLIRETDALFIGDENEFQFSVSPFGNREVVLLLTDLADVDSVNIILNRIYQTTQNAIILDGTKFYSTTNIGISTYPDDGSTAARLLKNASIAKREAMRLAGENNHVYSREIVCQKREDESNLELTLYKTQK